jgi:hypothetical protein
MKSCTIRPTVNEPVGWTYGEADNAVGGVLTVRNPYPSKPIALEKHLHLLMHSRHHNRFRNCFSNIAMTGNADSNVFQYGGVLDKLPGCNPIQPGPGMASVQTC